MYACTAHQSHRFIEFNTAFKDCKGQFDVLVNCVSAKVDFSGMLGMLTNDGVAVQVCNRLGLRHLTPTRG